VGYPSAATRLALSHLSYEMLDQCQRRWILQYAGDHLPDSLKWHALQQKKLTLWPWFVGSVVDATISDALLHYKREGRWPANVQRRAHRIMCHWWEHSVDWTYRVRNRMSWPNGNGYQPIDRHYYGEPIVKADWEKARSRVFQCVGNFMASSLPNFVASFPTECWRGPRPSTERVPKYQLGQVPVWASYDFAVRTAELTYIFDWKSGEPADHSCRRARQQLLWYALYAVQEWNVPVEQVRLCPVWLRPNVDWRIGEVTQAELNGLRSQITDRYDHLSARLLAIGSSSLTLQQWPMTDNLRQCVSCPFRGVCEGSKRQPGLTLANPVDPHRHRE
jgi:hypothetical protein